jgi:hypothetical protein
MVIVQGQVQRTNSARHSTVSQLLICTSIRSLQYTVNIEICIYIYTRIYIHIYIYSYIYIYMYIFINTVFVYLYIEYLLQTSSCLQQLPR